MELQARYYHRFLYRQLGRKGWVPCLVWGIVKVAMEGIAYFFKIENVWMISGLGLIWLGIVASALVLFLATRYSLKMLEKPAASRVRPYFIVLMIGLVFLTAQLPLLILTYYFVDGLLTIATTLLFAVAGYRVSAQLRSRGWSEGSLRSSPNRDRRVN